MGLISGENVPQDERRLEHGRALLREATGLGRDWSKRTAQVTGLEVSLAHDSAAKRARNQQREELLTRLGAPGVLGLPTGWRGKAYRRQEEAGDDAGRQKAETKEREKWGREVIQIILNADLPFGMELRARGLGAHSPEAARCLRGLRANSLRKRVSDWAPYGRWLTGSCGKAFPDCQEDILGYFQVRQAEGAARTAYQNLLDALAFFETAGEAKAADWLHKLPALTGAAKEATAQRARDQEADRSRPSQRQAPPLLVALVVALEQAVGEEQRPVFERCYAWYRLLRHWASLRYDDTAGLPPQTLELRLRGLVGVLQRTKTSGADKKMSCLPIFVAKEAYIHEEWLEKGLDLWRTHLGYARDYLLCLPTEDLGGTIRKRARYADAQCFSKALLSSLRAPGEVGALLLPQAVSFWSERSDRAGVDSWLAAVGVGGDHRRFLGRWAAGGAQDVYVRTALRICEKPPDGGS